MNRQFSKEDVQMANKHEKMFNITNNQGNANKTTRRYHLTSARMAIIKNSIDIAVDVGKKEYLYIVVGNVYLYNLYGKQFGDFFERTNSRSTIGSSNPTTWYLPKGKEIIIIKRHLHMYVYSSTIHYYKDVEPT